MIEKTSDQKRLEALASAASVFVALDLIGRYRDQIAQQLALHNPNAGDQAQRRDCAAFEERLRELALWDRAKQEASR